MTENSNLIKSLMKAVDVIDLLSVEGELGISEISKRLGITKSNSYRLVATLKEKGLITQNMSTQKYSNAMKLFEIGNRVVERMGLRRQAQFYLKELAEKTNETVNIAILDEKEIVYIDKIESSATIKVDLSIGKRLPVYCTGLGKIILAYMDKFKRDEIIRDIEFVKYTDKTVRDIEELKDELGIINYRGYSIDDEEYVEGLKCYAAPIFDFNENPIAAVSVAIPKYRFENFNEADLLDALLDTSSNISEKMGYRNLW